MFETEFSLGIFNKESSAVTVAYYYKRQRKLRNPMQNSGAPLEGLLYQEELRSRAYDVQWHLDPRGSNCVWSNFWCVSVHSCTLRLFEEHMPLFDPSSTPALSRGDPWKRFLHTTALRQPSLNRIEEMRGVEDILRIQPTVIGTFGRAPLNRQAAMCCWQSKCINVG